MQQVKVEVHLDLDLISLNMSNTATRAKTSGRRVAASQTTRNSCSGNKDWRPLGYFMTFFSPLRHFFAIFLKLGFVPKVNSVSGLFPQLPKTLVCAGTPSIKPDLSLMSFV